MEQQKKLIDPKMDSVFWTIEVIHLIDIVITYFPPSNHFELDTLPLWFFILDLVNDSQWTIDSSSEAKVYITI